MSTHKIELPSETLMLLTRNQDLRRYPRLNELMEEIVKAIDGNKQATATITVTCPDMMDFAIFKPDCVSAAFTAKIPAEASSSDTSQKKRLALLWALENSVPLTRCDFRGVDASGIDFRSRDISGSDFTEANLEGANLSYCGKDGTKFRAASLLGIRLRGDGSSYYGADFYGAIFEPGNFILTGPRREDGYDFFLKKLTGDPQPYIVAGCRILPISAAREHWRGGHRGLGLTAETMAILDYLERTAIARGLIPNPHAAAKEEETKERA